MTLWEVFLEGPGIHGAMLVLALPLALLASLLLKLLSTVVLSRSIVKGLPSAPFKPPNGQGSEKFFDGRRGAQKWRRKYGSMYSIWSGFKREIVLTKPEHVKAFYKDSHMHIKATDNNAGWLFGELLGQCVGVASRQEWRRVRKPFESHFTRSASIDRIGSLITEAAGFLNSFHVDNSSRDEHIVIHAADDLKYCPFFMVASIFFGELTAEMRTELAAIGPPREALFRDTFLGGISRYAIGKYFPGSAVPRLREFQQRWDGLVRRACREARVGIQKGAAILDLWKALEDGSLSMKELLQTLDESLFANLDVTANATAWTVIRIAQHPDVQEDLRRELHTYTQTKGSYADYLCREETLLAACILEVSRLHPILPFSNPESSPLEKTVGGYVIPKYTDVIVDAYAINVDNPYWESPLKFDPSRHLGKKDIQARRYNMWRFGFGPRQCLGKNVADLILRVIVAELLQRYQLEMAENRGKEGVELQADSWIGLPDGRVKLTPLGQNSDARFHSVI